jgi:outer membrane protease
MKKFFLTFLFFFTSFHFICSFEGVTFKAIGEEKRGNTTYYIHFLTEGEEGFILKGESKLEFPLDISMAGVNLTLRLSKKKLPWDRPLTLNIDFLRNISQPEGVMKDSDWFGLPDGSYRRKFSFTESTAKLQASEFNFDLRQQVFEDNSFVIHGVVGFRYYKYIYDILGVKGWQLNEEGKPFYFDEYQGEKVLFYRVSYKIPYLGMVVQPKTSGFFLEGSGFFSPFTAGEDFDDHLLRNKKAEGNTTGYSLLAGAKCHLTLSHQPVIFLEVGVSWRVISTKGKQTQEWYGDDPCVPGDETGRVYSGIPIEITSTTRGINAAVGVRFK